MKEFFSEMFRGEMFRGEMIWGEMDVDYPIRDSFETFCFNFLHCKDASH